MKTTITYKHFKSLMEIIKKADKEDERFGDFILSLHPDNSGITSKSQLHTQLLDWIIEVMDDKESDWIGTYVYEYHWGTNKLADSVRIDGKKVSFRTIKDLYNLITNQTND